MKIGPVEWIFDLTVVICCIVHSRQNKTYEYYMNVNLGWICVKLSSDHPKLVWHTKKMIQSYIIFILSSSTDYISTIYPSFNIV